MFIIRAIALGILASVAQAKVVSTMELCERGDIQMCRAAELEKEIDFRLFDKDYGQYSWQPNHVVLSMIFPRNAKERAGHQAAEYCTSLRKIWISPEVADYARLMDFVPVDRVAYQECVRNASKNYLRDERQRLLLRALEIAAIVVMALGGIAVFWYRRPLAHGIRNLIAKINKLGAK